MLVRVTKQTTKTITEKQVFYVESGSIEEAENFISETKNITGHYTKEESQPKEHVYGLVADFTGYAKILVKRGKQEQHIVYSMTLNKKDIETAMLEQIPDFVSVYFRKPISEPNCYIEATLEGTSYRSYDVEVLEQPTLSDQDIKAKKLAEFFASIPMQSKDEDEEDDSAIYDDKYFQFLDHLKKHQRLCSHY